MSELYFWPDAPGDYILEARSGDTEEWRWDGMHWYYLMPGFHVFRSPQQMVEASYLVVRREAEPVNQAKKAEDDAATAREAKQELSMCRKPAEFERWAIKWGRTLCEIAGAR